MPNLLIRSSWFVSSYTPLWLLIAIKYIRKDKEFDIIELLTSNRVSMVMLLVALLSSYATYRYIILVQKGNKNVQTNCREYVYSRNQSKEALVSMEYLVTYIIGLIGFNFNYKREILMFVIFIFMFLYMYIKYNLFYMNPILEILKYNIYRAELFDASNDCSKGECFIITNISFEKFCKETSRIYNMADKIFII